MESTHCEVGEKMISGHEFISSVKKCFLFLIKNFSFELISEKNRPNLFYDVEYQKGDSIISISFETREDYLQVILFRLKNGQLPEYDDKEATIHLENLNKMILHHLREEDFKENNIFFSSIIAKNQIEKRLIKSAKELRLCLKNIDLLNQP